MIDTYHNTAHKYLTEQRSFFGLTHLNEDDFNHVVSLAASVMMTRDEFLPGGGFVQAVVDNNLSEAIGRADSTALIALKALVMTKMWCHL